MTSNRTTARQLEQESLAAGDATGWFERLYRLAGEDTTIIPWADLRPNSKLMEWMQSRCPNGGQAKTGLVIGCGLGDDAEELARAGFKVTAIDISATAVEWCRWRFPDSTVNYCVADLFELPETFLRTFDLVVEIYTLQALPIALRHLAIEKIADCVGIDGRLLVVARGRDETDDPGQMPRPLTRLTLDHFTETELSEIEFEDYVDNEEPPVRRFCVEYRR